MFTGIVSTTGKVIQVEKSHGLSRITVSLPAGLESALAIGASISIDGVCLTVTSFSGQNVSFDVMHETLVRTTLGTLTPEASVNIERSTHSGQEVGGHILSGHVDCTAEVAEIRSPANNYVLTFRVPQQWMKYIFAKGFVALNGCSLTVTDPDYSLYTFQVWLIPETLRVTTFGAKKSGDQVNLEVDRTTQVIVDTVHSFLATNLDALIKGHRPGP